MCHHAEPFFRVLSRATLEAGDQSYTVSHGFGVESEDSLLWALLDSKTSLPRASTQLRSVPPLTCL